MLHCLQGTGWKGAQPECVNHDHSKYEIEVIAGMTFVKRVGECAFTSVLQCLQVIGALNAIRADSCVRGLVSGKVICNARWMDVARRQCQRKGRSWLGSASHESAGSVVSEISQLRGLAGRDDNALPVERSRPQCQR